MPAVGYVSDFSLRCKRPDGTWIDYIYLPREYGGPKWWDPDAKQYVTRVKCAVGSGNILFYSGCIAISNYGNSAGTIFGDLYQNGTRILYKSVPNVSPSWGFSMPDSDKYWDMPSSGLTFTLKAGHDTTVDETVSLPVDPWAQAVSITVSTAIPIVATFICCLWENFSRR